LTSAAELHSIERQQVLISDKSSAAFSKNKEFSQSALRIAQVAPLAESVPPKLYGGTERVIAWLADELVELGHCVTLVASGDSRTKAKLIAAWPAALRLAQAPSDPGAAQAVLLDILARHAREFDIIHCHLDWLHLPTLSRLHVPYVTTLHGRLDVPGLSAIVERFPGAPFVSISNDQRAPLQQANWLGTVYHGLPANALLPSFVPGSYLVFLGRLSAEKGPECAIRIARGAGMPLRIAAKVPRAANEYFAEVIEPLIDGRNIALLGEVDDRSKQTLLANALGLLFPIDWPEPFGLVLIEAMASGTPVVAFRRGAVPEIVEDGVTGFIVDTADEAIDAVRRLPGLDRRRIRARFESRFTARRMAQEYVEHYRSCLAAVPIPGSHRE
jgi:glycosyltransferase involved in cell wall biosynthesis